MVIMIYEPNTPDSQELVLTFKSHSDRKLRNEFNRMSKLELAHETNGTLHLLYPCHYPHDYMEWYELLANDTTAAGVQDT